MHLMLGLLIKLTSIIKPHHISYIQPASDDKTDPSSHIDHVEVEISSIIVSHTVVEPWTVMIHDQHAAVAYRTVVGAWWFRLYALLAYAGCFHDCGALE